MDVARGNGASASSDDLVLDPSTLSPSILNAAIRLSYNVRILLGLRLAPLGLVPGQERLLVALLECGNRSQNVLSEFLPVRPSTISKMVERLVQRDLVRQAIDHRDQRRNLLELTPKGVQLANDVQAVYNNIERELRALGTEDEIKMMEMQIMRANDVVLRPLRRLR